jgi:hypothetical protein
MLVDSPDLMFRPVVVPSQAGAHRRGPSSGSCLHRSLNSRGAQLPPRRNRREGRRRSSQ